MNMKTAYKVYLFCCVLFLTGLFLLVPVYAVEDMWTAASRIIKDIYTHIASVSTVLAGLMTAIAVIGAKMSNETHLAGMGHYQRHRRVYRLCCPAVSGACYTGAVKHHAPRTRGVTDYA